jgi:hypothetical protein
MLDYRQFHTLKLYSTHACQHWRHRPRYKEMLAVLNLSRQSKPFRPGLLPNHHRTSCSQHFQRTCAKSIAEHLEDALALVLHVRMHMLLRLLHRKSPGLSAQYPFMYQALNHFICFGPRVVCHLLALCLHHLWILRRLAQRWASTRNFPVQQTHQSQPLGYLAQLLTPCFASASACCITSRRIVSKSLFM